MSLKTLQKGLSLLSLMVLSLFYAYAGPINFIEIDSKQTWNDALETAKSQNKLVFVDVYTDWCGYCKMMDRDVFSDEEVATYHNTNFVNVKLDAEGMVGRGLLVGDMDVSGYPTYLYLGTNGQVVKSLSGYQRKEALMAENKSALGTAQAMPMLEEKYANGALQGQELAQYILLKAGGSFDEQYQEQAQNHLSQLSLEALLSEHNWDLALVYATDLSSQVTQTILSNYEMVGELRGEEGQDAFVSSRFEANMRKAVNEQDVDLVQQLINEILPVYVPQTERLPEVTNTVWKIYYGAVGDYPAYANTVMKYFNAQEPKDYGWLFSEARTVLEEYNEVPALLEAAQSWVEIIIENDDDFPTRLLMGYLLGTMEKYDQALVHAQKALDYAADEDEKETANELVELIKDAKSEEEGQ